MHKLPEIISLNLFCFFVFFKKKKSHIGLSQVSPVALFMDNFWYSLARIQCVFLTAWESLAVWASEERSPEDSEFPFQTYLWKSLCCRSINIHLFLALRPTTSPAAVSSSSLPHPSLNDSCFHSVSPRVEKKKIYYTHRWPKQKRSHVQNDPGKVKKKPSCVHFAGH